MAPSATTATSVATLAATRDPQSSTTPPVASATPSALHQAPGGSPGASAMPAANAAATGASGIRRHVTGSLLDADERTKAIEPRAPDASDAAEVIDRRERAA